MRNAMDQLLDIYDNQLRVFRCLNYLSWYELLVKVLSVLIYVEINKQSQLNVI